MRSTYSVGSLLGGSWAVMLAAISRKTTTTATLPDFLYQNQRNSSTLYLYIHICIGARRISIINSLTESGLTAQRLELFHADVAGIMLVVEVGEVALLRLILKLLHDLCTLCIYTYIHVLPYFSRNKVLRVMQDF